MSLWLFLCRYRALGLPSPAYYHAPLVNDPVTGVRLAKRHDSLSLRALRERGVDPAELIESLRPAGNAQLAPVATTAIETEHRAD